MGTLLSAISPLAQPFSQKSCVGLPRRPRRAEEKVSAARGAGVESSCGSERRREAVEMKREGIQGRGFGVQGSEFRISEKCSLGS